MILIVSSSHSYDQGTEAVIEWLNHYKAKFLRISLEDIYNGRHDIDIRTEDESIICDGINISQDVNVILFRKKEILGLNSNHNLLERDIFNEKTAIIDYIFHALRNKTWLPNYSNTKENKLIQLDLARRNNLLVPKTLITNRKDKVRKFKKECSKIINKPIFYCSYYIKGNQAYTANTIDFDDLKIEELPESFPLSLFQEAIIGDSELRCFYIDDEIFTTVTYHNTSRHIDVKLNNGKMDTNYVEYILSEKDRESISNLMKELGLNTGSIDLIKKDKLLYFLEVNPVGQFLFESRTLNFEIDKKIAEWLINNDVKKMEKICFQN